MMPPVFVSWLKKEQCSFQDGTTVECWHLDWQYNDNALDEWALHLRRHYVRDKDLADRCRARNEQPSVYLPRRVVPSKSQIRSGDFAEILISDVLEYLCKYAVPRYKQLDRTDKNSSEHGVDVIAYRIQDCGKASTGDELLTFEVKSDASGTQKSRFLKRVENAATDSKKDPNRGAFTLDYMIDRAIDAGDTQNEEALMRFANKAGVTFREAHGSAVTTSYVTPDVALSVKLPDDVHLGADNPLVVVYAQEFMSLINDLYGRMTR